MDYRVVIGLEVHAELNTKTKVFCGCQNVFGGEPNTHCCPVCIGLPGSLPRVNKAAIEKTVKAGLATNCKISNEFIFERKNYFYPDLAKAYQISQDTKPICKGGYIEIVGDDGNPKKIRLNRIHLEEDAGKLIHSNRGETYVDYNRGGVPLIETVTEPDISSAKEAVAFLNSLKELWKTIGVSDCKMEQGSLRCDVNVSLCPVGSAKLGNRTEMKNLNSFKAVERAINYEIERQREILMAGGTVDVCTLKWDDEQGYNFVLRSKENANDYRYFPEPDIYPCSISDEEIEKIKADMPRLPKEIREELTSKYGLSAYDADLISRDMVITKFFYDVIEIFPKAKTVSNWIMSEINKRLNLVATEETEIKISPEKLVEIISVYEQNKVSQQGARQLFDLVWNGSEETIANLIQINDLGLVADDGQLEEVVRKVVDSNPKAVEDYKGGNKKAFAFFIGAVMKETKGKADAGKVNALLDKILG